MEKYSPSEEFLRRKAEEKEKLKLKRGTNIISQWDTEDKFMCYFAYLFSNWKSVASAHPQMDPGQVQSFLWEKWSSSSQTGAKRKKLKKSRKEINTEETVGGSCADMEAVREDNMEVQHVQENMYDIGNSTNDCEVTFTSIKDKPNQSGETNNKCIVSKNDEPREVVKDEGSHVPAPCKTAYNFYLECMKTEIVKVLPDITEEQKDVALAKKWETISWDQKKVFHDEAEKDVQRYMKELSGLEK